MSDVLPSIIVLAMSSLFVFRCELGPRKAPARRRRKTQQSARSFKSEGAQRHVFTGQK